VEHPSAVRRKLEVLVLIDDQTVPGFVDKPVTDEHGHLIATDGLEVLLCELDVDLALLQALVLQGVYVDLVGGVVGTCDLHALLLRPRAELRNKRRRLDRLFLFSLQTDLELPLLELRRLDAIHRLVFPRVDGIPLLR
jgi:hypothetical protein